MNSPLLQRLLAAVFFGMPLIGAAQLHLAPTVDRQDKTLLPGPFLLSPPGANVPGIVRARVKSTGEDRAPAAEPGRAARGGSVEFNSTAGGAGYGLQFDVTPSRLQIGAPPRWRFVPEAGSHRSPPDDARPGSGRLTLHPSPNRAPTAAPLPPAGGMKFEAQLPPLRTDLVPRRPQP